jgi:hypothetical protein
MNNKLKPALIGGVLLGLLSAIPVVNLVNICCCLWALIGGLLASYLYIKNSPVPARAGDGAILGVLAGLVGAVIVVVIGIPISIIAGGITRELLIKLIENVNPGQAEAIRIQMEAGSTIAGAIVNGIILAVLLVIFSTIGGLLGVPIFEKRKGPIPPPPPQM